MKTFTKYFLTLIIFLGGISELTAHTENNSSPISSTEFSSSDRSAEFIISPDQTIIKSRSTHTKENSEASFDIYDEEEEEVNSFDEDINNANYLSSHLKFCQPEFYNTNTKNQVSFHFSTSPYSRWARYLVLCVFRI
jgi:hypothetical protein